MSYEIGIEMPRYQSIKKIWGLQINEVKGTSLSFVDNRYADIDVGEEYINKHKPEATGYYVVYEGGYKSFCPKEPFESGNLRID